MLRTDFNFLFFSFFSFFQQEHLGKKFKTVMRYKFRLQCETLTKQGKRPCNAPGILMKNGRIRCKVHGGYSTGPKSAEGKARSANNIIKYNEQRISNNKDNS